MDTGPPPQQLEDLQSVIRMTLNRADGIVFEWQQLDEWIKQTEANVKAARDRQDELNAQWHQCHATAALFGFDLNEARKAMQRQREMDQVHDEFVRGASIPPPKKTVREALLELGREAQGQPLRAADLRKTLEDRYEMQLHEKTVGMTLYRLSKEGAFKRRGYDWYFVPEAERVPERGILSGIDMDKFVEKEFG